MSRKGETDVVRISQGKLEHLAIVVEKLKGQGMERVTAQMVSTETGWPLSTCLHGLKILGLNNRRGKPKAQPVDWEEAKHSVRLAITALMAGDHVITLKVLAHAVGYTQGVTRQALKLLGLRVMGSGRGTAA